ncbi:MAG: saccharopine dehydrogenase NADP-binding domain-containing protein [Phycisphaerales bacterium]|nr:saccharopine dehydrogenase NADP-binding domain-containing protein [Phycisphaerales bacterium]
MHKVLILGGGKVGKSVAELLLACGRGGYGVTVVDREPDHLREAEANLSRLRSAAGHAVEFETRSVNASDRGAVRDALRGHDAVVCMLPFDLVAGVAEIAADLGVHYFDVTEDVKATEGVRAVAARGGLRSALVPQCGLAPGYIAIAAHHVARQFDAIHDLTLRVGALPQYPTNALKYNITWSAAGVVNEYCEPCRVMLEGALCAVPALEGLERFSFQGVEYEAFYTSGGVGSLVETLVSEGRTTAHTRVAYKTIRYPGHRDLMRFLLQDLRLGEADAGARFNRRVAVELLEHAVPRTLQDVVVVFVSGVGERGGRREQINFMRSIPATTLLGRVWPAIELTTAAGVCAMVDLHRLGRLPAAGLVRQEDCTLEMFNATVFGLAYEAPDRLEAAAMARG